MVGGQSGQLPTQVLAAHVYILFQRNLIPPKSVKILIIQKFSWIPTTWTSTRISRVIFEDNFWIFRLENNYAGKNIIHIILQQILHESHKLTWILFFTNFKLFKFATFDEQDWAHIGCMKTWISLVLPSSEHCNKTIWWPQLTLCLIQTLFCLHVPYFSVILLYFIVKEKTRTGCF